jgi:hypothetical protein
MQTEQLTTDYSGSRILDTIPVDFIVYRLIPNLLNSQAISTAQSKSWNFPGIFLG